MLFAADVAVEELVLAVSEGGTLPYCVDALSRKLRSKLWMDTRLMPPSTVAIRK